MIQEQPLPKAYNIPAKKSIVDYSELFILARNIYHEARGEPLECQYLVAAVTLNRVSDNRWPSSIEEVILQPYQFSWVQEKVRLEIDEKSWSIALTVAEDALTGYVEGMSPSLWYHTYAVNPSWNKDLTMAEQCGNHQFFMEIP